MLDGRLGGSIVARIIGNDYNRHVAASSPTDFWGQVRRHVYGRPIGKEQIDLIVQAIVSLLGLNRDDSVLDLACGNGALSARLSVSCATLAGVDVSESLIAVANRHFADPGRISFDAADIADYVEYTPHPGAFTKALCYGSFPYLTEAAAGHVLSTLARRFPNIYRVFIGNLPDTDRASAFYPDHMCQRSVLGDPLSEIGIWRTPSEFISLAENCGWKASVTLMPPAFYAAHYRYDATLTRR